MRVLILNGNLRLVRSGDSLHALDPLRIAQQPAWRATSSSYARGREGNIVAGFLFLFGFVHAAACSAVMSITRSLALLSLSPRSPMFRVRLKLWSWP